jgi:hypothetical protein
MKGDKNVGQAQEQEIKKTRFLCLFSVVKIMLAATLSGPANDF